MNYETVKTKKIEERDYLIINALDISVLEGKVNSKLEEGFVTSGGLVYGEGRYAQVMTKKRD